MRLPLTPPRRARLNAEDGFTLIELLVTILVLTVGIVGLLGAFTSARKLTFLSERRTSAAHRAQLEIERLQTLTYGELAMSSEPLHEEPKSTETAAEKEKFRAEHPDYYVKAGIPPEYQYGADSSETEKLAIEPSTGKISREPAGRKCSEKIGACEWGEGTLTGNVYDFVTWHHDTNTTCAKTENYKRLTVVVTVKVPSSSRAVAPTRVSTLVANPRETKTEFEGC
jgi:prepilin-type N-terminal cleavage/methylation domain-containing protein